MPVILPNDIGAVAVSPFTTQGTERVPLNFVGPVPSVVGAIDANGAITGLSFLDVSPLLAGAVILAPGADTRNVISPSGDFRALATQAPAGYTKSHYEAIENGGNICFLIGASGRIQVKKQLGLTVSTTDVAEFGHNSTGTPAGGFGSRVLWKLESDTTPDRDAASEIVIWATATDATRKARYSVNCYDAGTPIEAMRLEATAGSSTALFPGVVSSPGAGASSEHFGALSSAAGATSVAIGNSSAATMTGGVAVGASAGTSAINTVSIGASSFVTAAGGIAIGAVASATGAGAIAIGGAATSTAANELVVGSSTANTNFISNAYLGSGKTDVAPTSVKLSGTGGSGSNVGGASFTLAGGQSTGSANGGDVIIRTSPAGGAGSALNALVTIAQFTGDSKMGFFAVTPVVRQANASAAGVAAVTDPNAAAALTAIRSLLLNYGLGLDTA